MQPPASAQSLADPIYEVFYGLIEQPFAITTDPKFMYFSASHQLAYNELLNGMRRREGLYLLTGETGTGKTTLSRAVVQALGPKTFSAMILNPYMSGAEVFRMVLRDFGLSASEGATGREARVEKLQAEVPETLGRYERRFQLARLEFVEYKLKFPTTEEIAAANDKKSKSGALDSVTLEKLLGEQLEEKCQRLLRAQYAYLRAIRENHAGWASAAGYNVGSMYEHLHDELVNLPAPPDLGPEAADLYSKLVRKKILNFDLSAEG